MIIINAVKIKVQIRNYPGADKKIVEKLIPEVAEKCVGSGCPNTRPFMHKQNPDITSTITTKPTPKLLPKPVPNKIPEKSNVDSILQQPVQSIADKVKPPIKSSTASSALEKLKTEDLARDVLESKNITKHAYEPLVPYLPKSSTTASPGVYLPKTPFDTTLVRLPLAEKVNTDRVSSSLPESSNTNAVTFPSQQTPSNSDTFQEEHKQKMSVVLEELKHKATAVQPEIYAETVQNGIVTESVFKPSTFTSLPYSVIQDTTTTPIIVDGTNSNLTDGLIPVTADDATTTIITENTILSTVEGTNINTTIITVEDTFFNTTPGTTPLEESFKSKIKPNTKVDDLSVEQMRKELLARGLVKEEASKTATTIKLKDDTVCLVGCSKNNIKLTPLGEGYYKQLKKNQSNDTIFEDIKIDPENVKYFIIVPKQVGDDCFVERGAQKHLLIAVDNATGKCGAIGYLTSKTTSDIKLSDKQYKKFQNQKEKEQTTQIDSIKTTEIENKKEKPQFFVQFDSFKEINIKEVALVKYSDEYVKTFSAETVKFLNDVLKEYKTINVSQDKTYATKKDTVEMCKEFDKVVEAKNKDSKSKIQHPLSPEQQKLNKKNTEQQKLKSKNKDKQDTNTAINNTNINHEF